MAVSSAPRAIGPRAASCRTASDAAAACRCWASSHVSKAAAPLTVMPSSRSAPSPGRPTAAVQVPFITTCTSTVVHGGSRSTTGSPSTDPSSLRARLITAQQAGHLPGRHRTAPDRHRQSLPSLAVLADRIQLRRDEYLTLPVHGVRRLSNRRVNQAEDLPCLLVHPVAQVADPVLSLG